MRVLRLVTNSWIEEEIMNKANYKMGLDEIIIQAGLFNQKSTDVERREKLEEIVLTKQSEKLEQIENENEIPSDDVLNTYIGRSEEEINEFDRLDQERYLQDKLKYKYFQRGETPLEDDDQRQFEVRSSMYRLL